MAQTRISAASGYAGEVGVDLQLSNTGPRCMGKPRRRLRARVGLTQEGLAHTLGVSVSTVQKWEGGRARPRGVYLRALEQLAQKARRLRKG
jgi:DNA-binding transcriptional regulator YiaG